MNATGVPARRQRRRRSETGFTILEATTALAVLALLAGVSTAVASGMLDYRLQNQAWQDARSAMLNRAEELRATDVAALERDDREHVDELPGLALSVRHTETIAPVDERPGLLRIDVGIELLDDAGRVRRSDRVEVLKARRQWP